jgi:hypothetical protein
MSIPVSSGLVSDKKGQLFRIIQSLSPAEKSYFKKFSYKTDRSESAVIALFDVIEKEIRRDESSPPEARIIAKFSKQFPALSYIKVKARLLALVCESLVEYDRHSSESAKLFDNMLLYESLNKRKLFDDALQVLRKAEKQSIALEETAFTIRIKQQLLVAESYVKKYSDDDLGAIGEFFLEAEIEMLRKNVNVSKTAQDLLHFQKIIGLPRKQSDLLLLQKIENSEVFSYNEEALTSASKIDRISALCGIYFSKGDAMKVIEVCDAFTQRFAPEAHMPKYINLKYISVFDSLMQACLMTLQIKRFEEVYHRFENIETFGPNQANSKSATALYVNCMYAILVNKLEMFEELHSVFDKLCEEDYIPNYRKISIVYYLILGSFMIGDYKRSAAKIVWLNSHRHYGVRYDLDIAIRVMELIISLEQKELSLLTYQIRAFYELLMKRERKFEMEALLIKSLKRLLNSADKSAYEKHLIDMFQELKTIAENNPAEKVFIQAFDIISWVESKLTKKSFREVYYKNNIAMR